MEKFHNELEIIGDDAQIASAIEFLKGKTDENGLFMPIDLNNIEKMQEELQDKTSNSPSLYLYKPNPSDDNEDYYDESDDDSKQANVEFEADIKERIKIFETKKETSDFSEKSFVERSPSEVDIIDERISWCYENWDSRINACNQQYEDDNIISFTTINGTGLRAIEKLSTIFPKVIFVYFVYCESPEEHLYTLKNGKIVKYYDSEFFASTILQKDEIFRSSSKLERKFYENLIKFKKETVS